MRWGRSRIRYEVRRDEMGDDRRTKGGISFALSQGNRSGGVMRLIYIWNRYILPFRYGRFESGVVLMFIFSGELRY